MLAVAGDFETASDARSASASCSRLSPAGHALPPRLEPAPEPAQTGERRLTVEGPGETTYAQVVYHAPQGQHPDFFAFTVLDSLLCGPSSLNMFGSGISNKTSRLYRALVEKELAVSVSGGLIGDHRSLPVHHQS